MTLPLAPPIAPMLAKLQREMPEGDGWLYEPKWDGFRAIVFRDDDEVYVQSRDRRPFNRYFPELEPAFAELLDKRCVIDGEIIIATTHGLDFDALQLRIHPAASRVAMLSEQTPAGFIAFDLLALEDEDLREQPMVERRRRLEELVDPLLLDEIQKLATSRSNTGIWLTPQTDDPEDAEQWFDRFGPLGLDGVIAKRADLRYVPGDRVMVKVKRQKTADCVIGGYRLSKTGDGIGSLLLGLYNDAGALLYVGHTSSFKAAERRELLKQMKKLEGGKSFGEGRSPGGPSRWSGTRDSSWVPVEPVLVCEVSFDKLQGDRFRHAATFLRWRTDKEPRECTFDQLEAG